MRRGVAAYDQRFHDGVNIIRGQNGSGKSTIADFIFYVLGGDTEDWKDAASQCDEVQAEVTTPNGSLTIRRNVHAKHSPISTYFGSMEDAAQRGLNGWEQFPLKRSSSNTSFSQVMFKSIGLPEARSEGASNITMHQLLRLCYSDQRTPASRLFRFEQFDTQVMREAVGDLIVGLDDFDLYELGLEMRAASKEVESLRSKLNGLLKSLPADRAYHSADSIRAIMGDIASEKNRLLKEVANVDRLVQYDTVKEHLRERQKVQARLTKEGEAITSLEYKVSVLQFEIRELEDFHGYLGDLLSRLDVTDKAAKAIGTVSFSHCPACGEPLSSTETTDRCALCHAPSNFEKEKSQYNRIRIDVELQLRETRQLLVSKKAALERDRQALRESKRSHESELERYNLTYAGSNGPREAFLSEHLQRIGHIDAEISYLSKNLSLAEEIDSLQSNLAEKEAVLLKAQGKEDALQRGAAKRRSIALTEVSSIGVEILKSDLKRQPEFENAGKMELSFRNDSVALDGKVNFAESSNVFLKNTAIFSLLLAAGADPLFFHPRFLLLDNIEDKGMEMIRSQLFQRLIVERATDLTVPYQVIFTTSMMNPELELQEYVIGPAYTEENRTLNLGY
jgi:uncharacterized Zn finger protein (UPF0148 family)